MCAGYCLGFGASSNPGIVILYMSKRGLVWQDRVSDRTRFGINIPRLRYWDSQFHNGSHICNYFEPDEFRRKINQDIHNSSSFCFHLNCRVQSDTFMFDLIAISEIFKHSGDMRLKLPGYHNLLSSCWDDSPIGGVGIVFGNFKSIN